MAGVITILSAKTKTELKKKVQEWIAEAKAHNLTDIRLGWDPKRVVKTEDGYQIQVWAHS